MMKLVGMSWKVASPMKISVEDSTGQMACHHMAFASCELFSILF